MNRRDWLKQITGFTALALAGPDIGGVLYSAPKFGTNPFTLGIASGDPSPDGFVLWTRLAPDPLAEGGMPNDMERVAVRWRVAEDEGMRRVVKQGTAAAAKELAHSVHVEVAGLRANRPYWYQFTAGGEESAIGRTRSAPAYAENPSRLGFAFASCQHYEAGYFTAYRHMLEEDIDLVVHLGDYIYEGGIGRTGVRQHNGDEIVTLADYRNRHALYKTDPDLQAAHARFPWVVTWDDHELDNNYAGEISEQHTASDPDFLQRRAVAYQAYYENMPLRASTRPRGPSMRLYRRVQFGRLARFHVLDTRQYRSDQPCGDGRKIVCPDTLSEKSTLLGQPQEEWLHAGLENSTAHWNILAQQVMMMPMNFSESGGEEFSMDQWSGYVRARERFTRFLAERKPSNPVILTGDIHSNWASEVTTNFRDLKAQVVAPEFVGTSISSGGDGSDTRPREQQALERNPHIKFFNGQRGYVRCEITPGQWRTDYRVLDTVTKRNGNISTRASFAVESGNPRLNRL